jgi:membrane-bound lytic murein transglycosylase D
MVRPSPAQNPPSPQTQAQPQAQSADSKVATQTAAAANKSVSSPNAAAMGPQPKPSAPQTEEYPGENFWQAMVADRRFTDCKYDPNIESWARRLTASPSVFEQNVKRMLPYLDFAWRQARLQGMPSEVPFLALVESDYRQVYGGYGSPAGWWQLMPETARMFKMATARGHDERLDPVKATAAALSLMAKNAKRFNDDWLLAIFAYNIGDQRIQNVLSAIGKSAGQIEHVGELSLPMTTQDHLHRLIAWGCIFAHPKRYHVALPAPMPPEQRFVQVRLGQSAPLDAIVRVLGSYGEEWKRQHPLIAKENRVRYGQTFLAPRDFNEQLAALGDLKAFERPEPPKRLNATPAPTSNSNRAGASSSRSSANVITAERGDAKRASSSAPSSGALSPKTPSAHVVGNGESLWTIARHYDMRIKEILALNPKLTRKSVLKLGSKIRLK